MLPDGTGICCYAFIYIYMLFFLLLLSIPFFIPFLNLVLIILTEWSTIPACPSLMCFFNMGDTEGTNSSKILCSMFVCFVLCKFVSGLILWFMDNLWFDDLRA